VSRFPAAFRPPAFASWVVLRPLQAPAFLTVGLPDDEYTPHRLSRCTRARHDRGGCPSTPGRRCPPGRSALPGRRLPLPTQWPVLHPAAATHRRSRS
jgi:hypothetical protein